MFPEICEVPDCGKPAIGFLDDGRDPSIWVCADCMNKHVAKLLIERQALIHFISDKK